LSHVMLGLFSILLQPCCLNALPSQASALWVFNEVSLLQDPPDALAGSVEAAEDTQAQEATWINSLRQFEDEKDDDSNAQKSSRHEYDDDEDYSWDKRFQHDPLEHSDSDEKMRSDYDAQEISLHDDDAKKISFHEDDDSMESSRHSEDKNEISFNDDESPAEGRQQDTESYEELLQILDIEIGKIFSLKMSFLYFFFVI